MQNADYTRRLLLCTLPKRDIHLAKSIYSNMSVSARNDPLTQFLMFKTAMRTEDLELAGESLSNISKAPSVEPNLLYACVLEAQQAGNRYFSLKALELVLGKYGNETPAEVHLPALLRCTIRMNMSLLAEPDMAVPDATETEHQIERLCGLFREGQNPMPHSLRH
jgi:hypothetical protein